MVEECLLLPSPLGGVVDDNGDEDKEMTGGTKEVRSTSERASEVIEL